MSGEAGRGADGGVNGVMRSSSVRSMKKEGVEESTLPGSQRRRYHASFSSLSPAPFSSLAAALP